jgi:hypothetical protein
MRSSSICSSAASDIAENGRQETCTIGWRGKVRLVHEPSWVYIYAYDIHVQYLRYSQEETVGKLMIHPKS